MCTVDILAVFNSSLLGLKQTRTSTLNLTVLLRKVFSLLKLARFEWRKKTPAITDDSALSSLFVAMSKLQSHNSLGENNDLG